MNLYGFANGDPVTYSDPFGLCPVCILAAAWAIYEVGSSGYDLFNAARTIFGSEASTGEKIAVGLAAGAGFVLPGGGYTAGIKIAGKQFGTKAATHMREWGLDVKNAADRGTFRSIIEGIAAAPDKVVAGTFRGQPAGVNFLIKGRDVVVTSPTGDFVTILKDGIENPSVKRALEAAK